MYRRYGKRLLDLILSVIALAVLMPAMLLIALLVRLTLGTPVLFRQQRVGRRGRPFTLYRFRIMTNARDAAGQPLPAPARQAWPGQCLHNSGLHRLPELINVLRGELSLVGPAPLLPRYLEPHSLEQMRRHEVRPGFTGPAQLEQRAAGGPARSLDLDLQYVEDISLWLDLQIMARAAMKIPAGEGIGWTEQMTEQMATKELRRL